MTHLPECERWFTDMPEPDECPACEMFRACEQRVRDESADDLTITRGVNYAHGYADGYAKGRKDAYAAGLDAARDAVAGLSEQWVCQDTVRDALAAIDALREEKK